ncbi:MULTISPECIES: aldo/keto reductase [unclassified Sphingomonas]|jgi:aryl-alcohol dehydrogenase-like predicted oxidoreductase|uniref:aldo/keto reductase n=1 Tax=unclassified Sphingomonas TaxID=196159 RepID=UPI00082F30A9|nr:MULTISPECIES: aldo/keto reductase [unclassified Sphingomonas]
MPVERDIRTPSQIGLGCARVGSFNNPQTLAESRALIAHALELGVTVLDTSNIYGQGDSEQQIGKAIRGRRARAFVVTKAGRGFSPRMKLLRPLKPVLRPLLAMRRGSTGATAGTGAVTARREGELRMDWSPAAIRESLHGSLRRLGIEQVDGFLLHSPPASVAGDAALGSALAALKAEGKVAHFGVSCDDIACLRAALTLPGLSLLQLPWDVVAAIRDTAEGAAIRDRGIQVMAREVIRLQPDVAPLDAVRHAIAEPLVTTALVGTTSPKHLAAIAALA